MSLDKRKFANGISATEASDASKKLDIQVNSSQTANTTVTVQSNATANRTLTLPDASDTLATATSVSTVQTNLDNHINDTTAAHAASAIANTPSGNLAATDVQAALNELQGDVDTNATNLTNHLNDTTAAHAASAIANTPSGNLAATDVQAALDELQTDVDGRLSANNPAFTGTLFDASSSTSVSIATTNSASIINVGTGTGINTVTIGGNSSFVEINGTLTADSIASSGKTITLNSGGILGSEGGSGVQFEGGGAPQGYMKVSPSDTTKLIFKAPNSTYQATLNDVLTASDTITLNNQTQTLTNKSISGATNTLSNIPQSAVTNLTTDLAAKAPSASPTLTTPTMDVVTLDGQASSPSNPSSGFYKMFVSDTTQKLTIRDSAGTETTVGSGSGGINYITANDGSSTTGWTTYADAAGTTPVDGTGGSPSVTFVSSSDTSLRGTSNFLFTHDAVDRQGEGFSYNFTIDASDKGKLLQISFDYLIASGTYSDGNLAVWIYDVTNASLIQPAPYTILKSGVVEKWSGEFQTASNSSSYRLIIHCVTNNATAYTVRFDNFQLGPNPKVYGSNITDWVSYTPTGSWTSNTSYSGQWRRVGDSMEVNFLITLTGAPNAATLTVNLPAGYSIDTTKIANAILADITGSAQGLNSGSGYVLSMYRSSTTAMTVAYQSVVSGIEANVTATAPVTWAATNTINGNFKVPIAGWSSSSQIINNEANSRVVAGSYPIAATTLTTNVDTLINIGTPNYDTTASMNNLFGTYTVPVSGKYRISTLIVTAASTPFGANSVLMTRIYKNNSYFAPLSWNVGNGTYQFSTSGSNELSLVAGDTIKIYGFVNSAGNITLDTSQSYITIDRLSGPSQVMAAETVSTQYTSTSTSLPVATAGTDITLIYASKAWDSHGAYNPSTGIFTAPVSGIYSVEACYKATGTHAAAAIGDTCYLKVNVNNGTLYRMLDFFVAQTTSAQQLKFKGSSTVRLNAGDTVLVSANRTTGLSNGGTIGSSSSAIESYITISRIGNY